jgi:hypothetical protein
MGTDTKVSTYGSIGIGLRNQLNSSKNYTGAASGFSGSIAIGSDCISNSMSTILIGASLTGPEYQSTSVRNLG